MLSRMATLRSWRPSTQNSNASAASSKIQLAVFSPKFTSVPSVRKVISFLCINVRLNIARASFSLGALEKNLPKLQKLFGQIFTVTTVLSFLTVGLFLTGGRMLVKLFVSSAEQSMIGILNYGMRIMPYSFLLFGYNIAARSTMANLQQTRYSGFLTVMHEIVFNNLTLVLLPLLFGLDSVWFSFLLTNVIMLVITIIVILRLKPEYYPETAE